MLDNLVYCHQLECVVLSTHPLDLVNFSLLSKEGSIKITALVLHWRLGEKKMALVLCY